MEDLRTDVLDRSMMLFSEDEKLPENDKDVVAGNDVWLGSGAIIAEHCVGAAGTTVTKDVGSEYPICGE